METYQLIHPIPSLTVHIDILYPNFVSLQVQQKYLVQPLGGSQNLSDMASNFDTSPLFL